MIRILVALDETAAGIQAQHVAVSLASEIDAELRGLALPPMPGPRQFGAGRVADQLAYGHESAGRVISLFRRACRDADRPFSAAKRRNGPDWIDHEIDMADLAVVGRDSRFYADAPAAPAAQVQRMLERCARPVMVTPPVRTGGAETALVAFDGSPGAGRALQAFVALGLGRNRTVQVVSVGATRPVARDTAARAVVYLRRHCARVRSRAVVSRGHPLDPLLEMAGQAAFLVMGAMGRRSLRSLLLGSCAAGVIEASPIPVMLSG